MLTQSYKTRAIPNFARMPKAELHLHLEGAPRWKTLRQVLHRCVGATLPEIPHFYAPEYRFTDFGKFKECFRNYIYPWLATPTGYAELIEDVVDSLVEQHIRYAELNFNVATVDLLQLDLEKVLEELQAGVERAGDRGTVVRIIVGIDRTQGSENALFQVRRLLPYPVISGFDIHGLESPDTRADLFRDAFAIACDAGKKIKAHAGEMDEPASIRAAVEALGVTQIGHGTSAIRDPEVVDLLVERRVVVEMCPTSNERLGVIPSYSQHPILELDRAGVAVTVNSDDPSWFGSDLSGEMVRLMRDRDVGIERLVQWTRNAFESAIVDEGTRSQFLAELDMWEQTQCKTSGEI